VEACELKFMMWAEMRNDILVVVIIETVIRMIVILNTIL